MTDFRDDFEGTDLDHAVWVPSYLPHWSSTQAAAATYGVSNGELRLTIPAEQGLWCAGVHEEPLRVSCIQSGTFSGPLGSTVGPQPFKEGLVVREEQQTMWGYTPLYGRIEVRMRGSVTPRSMFAFWLSGVEDQPERSGEICVAEIFGDAIVGASAAVGMGLHQFRDPALREEFAAERVVLDVTEFHTYGVDWRPDGVAFDIDGTVVRELDQSPDYPMQLMLGVFDFPTKASLVAPADVGQLPELVATHVRGTSLA